ncbi:MAG: universal stress protein [Longimicrobiales bacterium]|nr:universal stress protein [Longimicrobiales bacterium]
MTKDKGVRIRRIVLAAHPSVQGRAALEVAAHLAATLGVELAGFYVQEESLLRLSTGSILQEVDAVSGRLRTLEPGDLERQIRAEASRIREAMARTAGRLGVHWSFQVLQGEVSAALTERAETVDLVAVGFRARSPGRSPGSTVRALLAEAASPVLVIRRGMRLGRDVHVIDDGSTAGDRAVELARMLAEGREGEVTVLSPSRKLSGKLFRASCGLLVLPKSWALAEDVRIGEVLRRVGCPVLVV